METRDDGLYRIPTGFRVTLHPEVEGDAKIQEISNQEFSNTHFIAI
jgi:hypothetical protein